VTRWRVADPGFSGLGFRTGGVADRYGQDCLAVFVEHFNLLMEAAGLSAPGGLTQELPGAFDCFKANRLYIRKLLTLPIVWEECIAISQMQKIAGHRKYS
jgi:hypothetical protein